MALDTVRSTSTRLTARIAHDKSLTGGGSYVAAVGRRVNSSNDYRLKLRVQSSGVVTAQLVRVVAGAETVLQSVPTVAGVNVRAGEFLSVLLEVDGTSPTTLRAKVWRDGATEPSAWTLQATDATGVLQAAGGVGFWDYLSGSSTNAPVTLLVDDLVVVPVGGGDPPPVDPPPVDPPPVDPPPAGALAADTFERALTGGWGDADIGGRWTQAGSAGSFSVSAGTGSITMTAGSSRNVYLNGVSVSSSDMVVTVNTDKVVTGGGVYVSPIGRRVAGSGEYRAKVRLLANGQVNLGLIRTSSTGTETAIQPEATVRGLSIAPGAPLRIRLQVTGTTPTTVRAKVWDATGAEPTSWTASASDATPALQTAGVIGFNTYLSGSASNAPVAVRFDNLMVTAAG